MGKKEKSSWTKLGLALATTPAVSIVGLLIVTVVGALDDAITKIQIAGRWWLIPIGGYVLSLIYFLWGQAALKEAKRKIKKEGIIDGLIFYWGEKAEKLGKPQPTDNEITIIRRMLLERIEVWGCIDPDIWPRLFRGEKYSDRLFEMVDNFMAVWQNQVS